MANELNISQAAIECRCLQAPRVTSPPSQSHADPILVHSDLRTPYYFHLVSNRYLHGLTTDVNPSVNKGSLWKGGKERLEIPSEGKEGSELNLCCRHLFSSLAACPGLLSLQKMTLHPKALSLIIPYKYAPS